MEDVLDRILHWERMAPGRPAVVVGNSTTSYGDLLRRARALASTLAQFDSPKVLIALPQISDAYAAIIATSLAGGYHAPVNIEAPEAKLRRIARVLVPDAIVSAGAIGRALRDEVPNALYVDSDSALGEPIWSTSGKRHRLAYVIFTSGSTGTPKGVIVSRTALNNYVNWLETLKIGPGDRVAQHANLGFDISMTDIFGALCFGASLYPVLDPIDRLFPARMIKREQITIWNSVPSVVSLMMQAGQVSFPYLKSVRLFNFCGEPLLQSQVEALFQAHPDVSMQNTYGPTEATISMTKATLTRENYKDVCRSSVSIGDPIPHMEIHLTGGMHDDEGEIVITGPQLAEGYWEDTERTAAVFRAVQVNEHEAARGYYTGDWAERQGGKIFFKERMDFQVKIRGFRVELEEVAAAIRDCGWPVVAVFKRGEALCAVVERLREKPFDEVALLQAVGQRVDRFAVPERVLMINRMPRNDNDKLDWKAAASWFDERVLAGD